MVTRTHTKDNQTGRRTKLFAAGKHGDELIIGVCVSMKSAQAILEDVRAGRPSRIKRDPELMRVWR